MSFFEESVLLGRRAVLGSRADESMALTPYLALVSAPPGAAPSAPLEAAFRVATYNVHRWVGGPGRARYAPERVAAVLDEIDADVIALQEVLRPWGGDDPLLEIASAFGLHVAFVVSRHHRRGELGNAILSRWPLTSVLTLDLSANALERRTALAAELHGHRHSVAVVATHLAIMDAARHRQVETLLAHPQLQGPVVLLGDLNAWRTCRGTRSLDRAFRGASHARREWPPSFPATRPLLALDRIYTRGATLRDIHAHDTNTSRRASDHLPVIANVELDAPR